MSEKVDVIYDVVMELAEKAGVEVAVEPDDDEPRPAAALVDALQEAFGRDDLRAIAQDWEVKAGGTKSAIAERLVAELAPEALDGLLAGESD